MRSENSKKAWLATAVLAAAAAISPRAFGQATYTWDSSGANPVSPVDGSGNWDSSAANWSNNAADVVWPNDNSIAAFGNGGTAGKVMVATPLNAGAILFNPVSSGAYTIAGSAVTLNGTNAIGVLSNSASVSAPIAGTNLITGGTGIVNLSGTNTYTGTTTIDSGMLQLGAAGALPSTTALTVNSAGTLDTNSQTPTVASLAGSGTVLLESSSNMTVNQTVNTTFSGALTGAGTLTKELTGGLTISSPQPSFTGTLSLYNDAGGVGGGVNNTLNLSGNVNVNNANIVVTNNDITSTGPFLSVSNLANALTAPITLTTFNGTANASGNFRFYINAAGGTNNVIDSAITANLGATGAPQVIFYSNTSGSSLTVNSAITVPNTVTGAGLIIFRGADSQSFNGKITAPSNIAVATTDAGSCYFNPQAGSAWGATELMGTYTLQIPNDSALTDGTLAGATNSAEFFGGRLQFVNYASNLSFVQANMSSATSTMWLGAAMGAPSTLNGSVTFNDTTNPVNFNGPGTLLFNGSLNYPTDASSNPQSGTITISGGTLQLGNSNAFPVVASPTISSGATLDLNGNSIEVKTIGTSAGNIMLTNGATLQMDAASGTLSGTISGTGSLYIYSGNLTLSGNNSFSGGTTVGNSASTLTLGNAAALGTGDVQLFGTLAIGTFSPTLGSLYGNGSSAVTGSGNLTVGADNNSENFSGVIKTTGSLTVVGTGTFTLNGNNTYTGATTVSSGTLQLGISNALPTTTGLTVASGATFDMNGQSQQIASLAGAGSIINTTALTIGGTTSTTFTGTMASGGSLTFASTATGTLTINSDDAVGGSSGVVDWASGSTAILKFANYTSNLSFNNAGNVILGASSGAASTLSGAVTGAGSLSFAGPGTLILTSTGNNYSGGTTITGGNLQIAAGALSSNAGNDSITITSPGALDITGAFATVNSALPYINTASTGTIALTNDVQENINFTANGGYASLSLGAAVNSNYTGTITPAGGTYHLGGGGAVLTLPNANQITGGNALAIQGNVALTNSNDFTGSVTLTSGTLQIASDAAINNGGAGITFSGGTLQFNNYSSSNLPAFDNVTNLKLGAAAGDASTVNEPITGTSALTYVGPGTLLFGSGVTLPTTSALTVSAGTLDLNGTSQTVGSLTGAGTIAIESGYTLSLGSSTATTASNTTFSGSLTGGGGLTKNNLGTLTLTGASTLTGPISIVQNSNAANSPTTIVLSGANASINSATINLINSTGTGSSDWPIITMSNLGAPLTAPITVTLGGNNDFRAGIENTAGANTVSGPITYNSTDLSSSTLNFLSTTGPMTISSAITVTGVKPQITFRGAGSSANVLVGIFNGSIGGSGTTNLIVGKTDTGKWIFDPAPGGTWATTNVATGILQMGGEDLLPHTSLLEMTQATATFDLNGYDQTVTGLVGTSATDIVTSSTTAAMLTINVPTSATTDTFGGASGNVISGPLTITINGTGSGIQAFAGANTYTGGTNLNGGTLNVAAGALGSGPVSFNGGTLVYTGTNTTDLTTNGLTINAGGATINTGSNAVTFANAITSNGPLTLTGGSLHIAASNNTIAGTLTIAGSSTLQLDGNTTASKLSGDGTGTLNITWGKVAVTAQEQSTLSLKALSIAPGAVLDLDNGNLAINYGAGTDPISAVAAYLKNGYDKGNWDGNSPVNGSIDASGIMRGTSLGYADSLLAADQVEVKYTWYGDLNLDGVVNGDDVTMMSDGLSGWTGGDLNYDGVVNADDWSLFMYGAASQNGSIGAGVPEPTTASLALVPLAGGFLSRRRRQK